MLNDNKQLVVLIISVYIQYNKNVFHDGIKLWNEKTHTILDPLRNTYKTNMGELYIPYIYYSPGIIPIPTYPNQPLICNDTLCVYWTQMSDEHDSYLTPHVLQNYLKIFEHDTESIKIEIFKEICLYTCLDQQVCRKMQTKSLPYTSIENQLQLNEFLQFMHQ